MCNIHRPMTDEKNQSDRSRGFGFIRMSNVEESARCIQELNGVVRDF